MDRPKNHRNRGGKSLCIALGILFIVGLPLFLLAESTAPQWWTVRTVTNGNQGNDYAAVNQGQIKNITIKAIAELDDELPGGAGDALYTLRTKLSGTTANTNDYAAVNLGQLKAVAKPIFDRLLEVQYFGHPLESGTYPWLSGSANPANDYAMANIGQVKNLFSFDLTVTGTNGLPDWWQNYYFGGPVPDPNAPAPSGVLVDGNPATILEAYNSHLNPIDFYSGQAPILTITNGNNQTGSPSSFLSAPLVVKVTDNAGNAMSKAPVIFTVTQGGGTLQATATGSNAGALKLQTNTSGYAIVYFQLPTTTSATCQITCIPATGNYAQAAVIFTEKSDNGTGSYGTPTLPSGNQPENPPTPPVVSYPAINVSGTNAGNNVNICALDDTNKMAFAFLSNSYTATVMTWTSGSTQTVQQVNLFDSFTVGHDDDPNDEFEGYFQVSVTYTPKFVTPSGKLYGSASCYGYDGNWDSFGREWGFSSSDGVIADIGKPSWNSFSIWAYSVYKINSITENTWGGETNVYGRGILGEFGIGFISVNGSQTYFGQGEVPTPYSDWTSYAVTAVNDGGWCLGSWGDWFAGQGGPMACGLGFIWNGNQVIMVSPNECFWALNNNNQIIGWDSSINEGIIWQGGARTVLTALIPADYQGEISGIFPRLISNSGTDGIIHILMNATFTDPTDGSQSAKTYVLSGPYAALSSTNCTLQEVQLPDGMSSSDIRCINANGWVAGISNLSTSSSGGTSQTILARSTMAASSSSSSQSPWASPPMYLGVDANRDGVVKLAVTGSDAKTTQGGISMSDKDYDTTSENRPYRFWMNDDNDFSEQDHPGSTTKDSTTNGIVSQRDLEDYARLQIYVGGYQKQFEDGTYQLGLEWKTVTSGTPSIKIVQAAENDGGGKYLTDDATATNQLSAISEGAVSVSSPLKLSSSVWNHLGGPFGTTKTFPYCYLLFDGVTEGKGQLLVTIWQGNTKISDGPSVWLDIKDIKKMYQRKDLSGKSQWPAVQFEAAPNETKQAIVFVHGWNMSPDGATSFAETMFKRLYWRGFKGRFAAVRWDTGYSDNWQWVPMAGQTIDAYLASYNDSEHTAWQTGPALKSFVDSLTGFTSKNIVAHSMGNIVVGGALANSMSVNNYALLQAAVPAACYDDGANLKQSPSTTTVNVGVTNITVNLWNKDTPDDDTDTPTRAMAYRGRLKSVGGTLTSFYLPQDNATSYAWELNNAIMKPASYFGYDRTASSGQRLYKTKLGGLLIDHYLTDPNEAEPYACRTWAKAAGAESRTSGKVSGSVDLSSSDYGFGTQHSAEFNWNIQGLEPFYNKLLDSLGIDSNP